MRKDKGHTRMVQQFGSRHRGDYPYKMILILIVNALAGLFLKCGFMRIHAERVSMFPSVSSVPENYQLSIINYQLSYILEYLVRYYLSFLPNRYFRKIGTTVKHIRTNC